MQIRIITTAFGPVRLEYLDSKKCKAFWNENFVGIVHHNINANEELLKRYCEYIINVFKS
jgi:hypothetical protein